MQYLSFSCIVCCMLTLSYCAPLESISLGPISNIGKVISDITVGIVDVVDGAVDTIVKPPNHTTESSVENTSPDTHTTESTIENSSPDTDNSQEDFAQFIVDIFTAVQAIIISTEKNIWKLLTIDKGSQ